MVVAYDGTDFNGFAPQRGQPGMRTVGGVLGQALGKVLRHEVELTCAGRTDAGVHAWGQVVSFPSEPGLDEWRLQSAVNSMLGPEVVVRSCETVAPAFDARRDAQWRLYRYTILNRRVPDPFRDRFVWSVGEPLDLRALRLAADPVRRRARLLRVLPQGPRRVVAHAARLRVALGRRGRRRAALRDPRQRVLLADGARHRRDAGGGRARPPASGRDAGRCCGRVTATRPGRWPRRADCASGKSGTDPTRISRRRGSSGA